MAQEKDEGPGGMDLNALMAGKGGGKGGKGGGMGGKGAPMQEKERVVGRSAFNGKTNSQLQRYNNKK